MSDIIAEQHSAKAMLGGYSAKVNEAHEIILLSASAAKLNGSILTAPLKRLV